MSEKVEFKFELGVEAKDIVSGFKGIIVARVEYYNGCRQYCIKPKTKNGEAISGEYFDEKFITILGTGISKERNGNIPGGNMADCPKE